MGNDCIGREEGYQPSLEIGNDETQVSRSTGYFSVRHDVCSHPINREMVPINEILVSEA